VTKKNQFDLLEVDISADKAALMATIGQKNREIAALNRQLESSAELTRMIVHDLKGPLASIMANLDLLLSPETGCVEREILETAIQGGEDLLNIINTLLEIGKMERGNFQLNLSVIDLPGMFKTAIGKLKSLAAQKSLTLAMDCRSQVSSVAADATLIERIIFNLVMNAIKYTRKGGTITLATKNGKTKDTVLLAVSDTGIGIPHKYHAVMFDLYTQLPIRGESGNLKQEGNADLTDENFADSGDKRKGITNVGIGLAFCKLATEQHGGSVWVESELGAGSTFFVSLPTNLIPSGSGLI